MSSLPFLAPIFLRRARQYRSEPSEEYNNTPSRSRGLRSNGYKLKDLSHHGKANTAVFTSVAKESRNGSDDNILEPSGIMKSVTYTGEVDQATKSKGGESEGSSSMRM